MPKKKRIRIFTTKLQVFAAIAWVLMCGMLTINLIDTYKERPAASPEVTGQSKSIIETYILGISIVTGICLLAWGVPFGPSIVYRIFTGQPVQPFKIDATKKRKKDKKA